MFKIILSLFKVGMKFFFIKGNKERFVIKKINVFRIIFLGLCIKNFNKGV